MAGPREAQPEEGRSFIAEHPHRTVVPSRDDISSAITDDVPHRYPSCRSRLSELSGRPTEVPAGREEEGRSSVRRDSSVGDSVAVQVADVESDGRTPTGLRRVVPGVIEATVL